MSDEAKMMIVDSLTKKALASKHYNYVFDKKTGFFARWGKTKEEDPDFSPWGPEIADIEITTSCAGIPDISGKKSPCQFCYKSNTPNGKNMSLETFVKVMEKLPKTVTQVAFGADSEATQNPDLWRMMEHLRDIGIIPNITVANITDDTADKLKKYCGAVAVSCYENKDICYNSVKKLTDRGMDQINIHYMICHESYDRALDVLKDIKNDERLAKLNAFVLLSLKQKGGGENFTTLSEEKFKNLVNTALDEKISIGFDSCSCHKFLASVKDHDNYDQFKMNAEPCESSCFSTYISVDAEFFPCSFAEGAKGWKDGLDVVSCDSFIKDIWNHPKTVDFRNKLLSNCRDCFLFKV